MNSCTICGKSGVPNGWATCGGMCARRWKNRKKALKRKHNQTCREKECARQSAKRRRNSDAKHTAWCETHCCAYSSRWGRQCPGCLGEANLIREKERASRVAEREARRTAVAEAKLARQSRVEAATCVECGASFMRGCPWTRAYCSRECQTRWRNRKHMAAIVANSKRYRAKKKAEKRAAWEAAGRRCQVCDAPLTYGAKGLATVCRGACTRRRNAELARLWREANPERMKEHIRHWLKRFKVRMRTDFAFADRVREQRRRWNRERYRLDREYRDRVKAAATNRARERRQGDWLDREIMAAGAVLANRLADGETNDSVNGTPA